MASTSTILHGVPLSQPFRSVAWALLLHNMPFQCQLTIPGASSKMGTMHESYKAKTNGRSTKVPLLTGNFTFSKDSSSSTSVTIGESPAILTFICDYHATVNGTVSPFYAPPTSLRKSTVDWYMHWHHLGLRPYMAKLIEPHLRSDLVHDTSPSAIVDIRSKAHSALEQLDRSWYTPTSTSDSSSISNPTIFLGGETSPSIADLLAFEEVIQVTSTGLLLESPIDRHDEAMSRTDHLLQNKFPNVFQWIQGMKSLPFYDHVHVPIHILGNLSPYSVPAVSKDEIVLRQKQMQKLLGIATKEGMKTLIEAQIR